MTISLRRNECDSIEHGWQIEQGVQRLIGLSLKSLSVERDWRKVEKQKK